jgi:cystathionine beta-lyase/cystathionine gamma-synthase
MRDSSVPDEQRTALNVVDNLVRISIGLENDDDLIEDLNQALLKAVN